MRLLGYLSGVFAGAALASKNSNLKESSPTDYFGLSTKATVVQMINTSPDILSCSQTGAPEQIPFVINNEANVTEAYIPKTVLVRDSTSRGHYITLYMPANLTNEYKTFINEIQNDCILITPSTPASGGGAESDGGQGTLLSISIGGGSFILIGIAAGCYLKYKQSKKNKQGSPEATQIIHEINSRSFDYRKMEEGDGTFETEKITDFRNSSHESDSSYPSTPNDSYDEYFQQNNIESDEDNYDESYDSSILPREKPLDSNDIEITATHEIIGDKIKANSTNQINIIKNHLNDLHKAYVQKHFEELYKLHNKPLDKNAFRDHVKKGQRACKYSDKYVQTHFERWFKEYTEKNKPLDKKTYYDKLNAENSPQSYFSSLLDLPIIEGATNQETFVLGDADGSVGRMVLLAIQSGHITLEPKLLKTLAEVMHSEYLYGCNTQAQELHQVLKIAVRDKHLIFKGENETHLIPFQQNIEIAEKLAQIVDGAKLIT